MLVARVFGPALRSRHMYGRIALVVALALGATAPTVAAQSAAEPATTAHRDGLLSPVPGRAARTVRHDRATAWIRSIPTVPRSRSASSSTAPRTATSRRSAPSSPSREGPATRRPIRATTTSTCSHPCSPVVTCCSSMPAAPARRRSSTARGSSRCRATTSRTSVCAASNSARRLTSTAPRSPPTTSPPCSTRWGSTASTCTATRTARSSVRRSRSGIPIGSAPSRSTPPTRSRIKTRGTATRTGPCATRSASCASATRDARHSVATSSTASPRSPTRCVPTPSPARPTTPTACCATSRSTPRSSPTSPASPRMARPCTRSSTVQGGHGSNAAIRRPCCASPPSRPTGPRSETRRCSRTASTSRSHLTTTRSCGTSRRRLKSAPRSSMPRWPSFAPLTPRRSPRTPSTTGWHPLDRVRVVHQLAGTRPLGATGRQPGHLPGGADARSGRRPRLDHLVRGVADRR